MEIEKQLDGKRFILEGTNLIYHFIKGTSTLDISGAGEINKSNYEIFRSDDGSFAHLYLGIYPNQTIHYQFINLRPLAIKLTGRESGKDLGTLIELL